MDQSLNALCDALKKILIEIKKPNKSASLSILTGSRNQGKSTLLRQSKLNHYPIEANGANIYYNQNGVILDLGESWLNQNNNLLQHTLKKINRSHKSIKINGLILCIDINELLTHDSTETKSIVRANSTWIKRLISAIGYPVDTSIIFTKLDLLTGFCDFFQNEHVIDLQKPCGFSLHEPSINQSLRDRFKIQFDYLIESLGQQVINKIHPVRSSAKRTLIREFPLQLASLRNIILPLINELSHKMLRLQSFYFTSGEQGGISIDRINQKIQQDYALTLQERFHQSTNHKAYFIEGALHAFQTQTQQIIPQIKVTHRRALGLLISTSFVIFLWMGHQYIKTSQLLDKASKELIAFDSLNHDNKKQDLATFHLTRASNALNEISANAHSLPTINALKMQLSMNTTQQISDHFLPNLLNDIENAIADPKQSQIARYQALKIYLMLGNLKNFSEKDILTWFKQHWQSTENNESINKKLSLLTRIIHNSSSKIKINKQIVTDARNFLNALPTSYLYYSLAKTHFSNQSIPIKFKGMVLSTDKIPYYFTKAGFKNVITELPNIIKSLKTENWVLERQDLKDLPILLQQAYCYEYVIWWQHFMQNSHPIHVQDYKSAYNLMQTIRKNNTINTLIDTIQQQTSPNSDSDSVLFNQEIASKFSELNLTSHSTIHHLIAAMHELEQFLSTLSIVNDNGKTAFTITKSRFENNAINNPLTTLYNQVQQIPEPLASWTKQIADDSWFTLINNSRAYINGLWQQQVFHEYQTNIAHRYPFDVSQTDEISINNFNKFFSTHGILNQFVNEYLKSFLDTSKPQWQLKEMNNYVLPISSDMINELIRANIITHMFFPNDNDSSHVEFSLQKISLDPIVARLQLTIGDTNLNDTQSNNSFTEFHWPQSNARLIVKSIEGQQYEIDELGAWAFFKLLQKVNVLVDEQNSANLQILFEINGNSGRYLLKAQSAVNPFIPGILNEFILNDDIV